MKLKGLKSHQVAARQVLQISDLAEDETLAIETEQADAAATVQVGWSGDPQKMSALEMLLRNWWIWGVFFCLKWSWVNY